MLGVSQSTLLEIPILITDDLKMDLGICTDPFPMLGIDLFTTGLLREELIRSTYSSVDVANRLFRSISIFVI